MAVNFRKISLLALFVICCLPSAYPSEFVPVFLSGDIQKHSSKSNPFEFVSSDEFSDIFSETQVNEPFMVIVVEETLSAEDLSAKNGNGDTAFPYMSDQLSNSIYLPAVSNPLQALNNVDPDKVDRVKLTEDGLSAEILPESGKYLVVYLKDAREGESRFDLLSRHDEFISVLFEKLKKVLPSVVVMYTGHHPSWTISEDDQESHRVRRSAAQVVAIDGNSTLFNGTGKILLYVKKVSLRTPDSVEYELTGGQATFANGTDASHTILTITYPNSTLELNFLNSGGYWFLNSINVTANSTVETLVSSAVYANRGFSFHCSQGVSYSGSNFSLTFTDFQVQYFEGVGLKFGDAFDCVGFTSVPIWTGLIVVFLLFFITFFGITMMMDLRTMDRFDDPKGKTITINTSE